MNLTLFLSFAATYFMNSSSLGIFILTTTQITQQLSFSLLSSNPTQCGSFPTHNQNHILDLILTSSDSFSCTISIWSRPNLHETVCWLLPPTFHSFRCLHIIDINSFLADLQCRVLGPLLFVMYTTPLSTLISSLSLNHYLYAVIYHSFTPGLKPTFLTNPSHLEKPSHHLDCLHGLWDWTGPIMLIGFIFKFFV